MVLSKVLTNVNGERVGFKISKTWRKDSDDYFVFDIEQTKNFLSDHDVDGLHYLKKTNEVLTNIEVFERHRRVIEDYLGIPVAMNVWEYVANAELNGKCVPYSSESTARHYARQLDGEEKFEMRSSIRSSYHLDSIHKNNVNEHMDLKQAFRDLLHDIYRIMTGTRAYCDYGILDEDKNSVVVYFAPLFENKTITMKYNDDAECFLAMRFDEKQDMLVATLLDRSKFSSYKSILDKKMFGGFTVLNACAILTLGEGAFEKCFKHVAETLLNNVTVYTTKKTLSIETAGLQPLV